MKANGLNKDWLNFVLRPYIKGEDLTNVKVSPGDIPDEGGRIAINPEDSNDVRYISKAMFLDSIETEE